jgi:hypothetical protein
MKSETKEPLKLTPKETENIKNAFDDPEFRKLFASYVDEMQNPANREENENYIQQLGKHIDCMAVSFMKVYYRTRAKRS